LVTESDLNIALSLCEVCPVSDIDTVSKTLLAVFDSRNKTMPLLRAIIEKEVINTGIIIFIDFYSNIELFLLTTRNFAL
jgi:hypothetical protein